MVNLLTLPAAPLFGHTRLIGLLAHTLGLAQWKMTLGWSLQMLHHTNHNKQHKIATASPSPAKRISGKLQFHLEWGDQCCSPRKVVTGSEQSPSSCQMISILWCFPAGLQDFSGSCLISVLSQLYPPAKHTERDLHMNPNAFPKPALIH